MKSRRLPGSPARATQSCDFPTEACWAICSMTPVSCAASRARASNSRAGGRWLSAAVVWGRLLLRRSPRRESPPSACSMPTQHPRKGWGPACAATTQALRRHYRLERPRKLRARGQCDAHGHERGRPMPMDVSRIAVSTFVGEVVMKQEMTAFLRAAQARGCRFQVGTDMLFEQIPAYLEFSASRAPRQKCCVRSPSCAIDRATAGVPIALAPKAVDEALATTT